MYFRISVLKNFAMFAGKHLCWSLFFNKYTGLKACNFIKKRLQHKFFPVKLAKFLRTPFFTEHVRRLVLEIAHELSLFTASENNEWCHFGVRMGLPALFSFYCVCFVSFYFFFVFNFFLRILLLFDFEVSLSILKIKQWSCF